MMNVKIGDIVWFEERWSGNLTSGKVVKTGMTDISKRYPEPLPYAEVQWDTSDVSGILFEDLYPTEEALRQGLKAKENAYIAKVKSEIHDVNDLVKFMYNNTVAKGASEYTNYSTRRAVREIAKDMLDLDLGV